MNTIFAVFSLIVLGYICARLKFIDQASGKGLGLFVFNIAIPALLFKATATVDLAQVAPWNLWGAFFGGLGLTWIVAALVARRVPSLDHAGGASASMASGFGNLAMLGTPLALSHFGQGVGVPLGIILSIHAPILWTVATLHREMARVSAKTDLRALGQELFNTLAKNAIVIALLAGALWRLTGLGLWDVPEKILSMLADASVPTALFALGVSLAGYALRGSLSGIAVLLCLKMLLMPLFVYVLVQFVFPLPVLYGKLAVLFAAMPTGANAFLFAQRNDEAVGAVSGAVAFGTALAALTTALLLYGFDQGFMG